MERARRERRDRLFASVAGGVPGLPRSATGCGHPAPWRSTWSGSLRPWGWTRSPSRRRDQFLGGRTDEARESARPTDSGDVLLVIENGFIAHKKQQKLFMPILRSERDSVLGGQRVSAVEASARVLLRTVIVMSELSGKGQDYVQAHEDGVTFTSAALSAVGMELITMAWPTYELDARRATGITVVGGGGVSQTPVLIEDLSAIALRDFEERKTSMLLRMIARGPPQGGRGPQERTDGHPGWRRLGRPRGSGRGPHGGERDGARRHSQLVRPSRGTPSGANAPALGAQRDPTVLSGPQRPETRTLQIEVLPGAVELYTVSLVGRDRGDQGRFRGSTRGVRYEAPRTRGRAGAR